MLGAQWWIVGVAALVMGCTSEPAPRSPGGGVDAGGTEPATDGGGGGGTDADGGGTTPDGGGEPTADAGPGADAGPTSPPGECSYEGVGDCGEGEWCSSGVCSPCAAGKVNCDLRGTCECEGSCTDGVCDATACDREDYDTNLCACGGDSSKFCAFSTGSCISCSDGFYNCDLLMGCESTTPCSGPPPADCT